ncbi:MAG: carbamoyltransferase HypF [Pseudomonadota bacterium]
MSKSRHSPAEGRRFIVRGAVQGVGFRPFVYRLAREEKLAGWVKNTPQGVVIEVEGDAGHLSLFSERLGREKPPNAVIDHIQETSIPSVGETEFRIIHSSENEPVTASILPDFAMCSECEAEMNDPSNRRFRYPFINCTHCGPRYTIIRRLPYDRPHTSMAGFRMCDACKTEYDNPLDRRFHAQPVACPECGPQIELKDAQGVLLAERDEALQKTADAVRAGKIVAMKGLGGFHLIADARSNAVLQRMRERKHRRTKPFALMYPSLEALRRDCFVSEDERRLLQSPASPIVLLKKKETSLLPELVAPGNPYLGAMLPYTPLHALLLQNLGFPVVATSGNRASEPICIDEKEALSLLSGLADVFLVHNRPIDRRADDSIVRVMAGRETILRRARGYAPLPLAIKTKAEKPLLAAGGHLKNTTALVVGDRLMLSPHTGDLDTVEALSAHAAALDHLCGLYQVRPDAIACDAHPDYASTRMAKERGGNVIPVQHHYAHALSCMADNGLEGACLAVVWDGTGYGDDGTIWGGEFLKITDQGYRRAFHFLPFALPGGEQAVREPRRAALGVLHALGKAEECDLPFTPAEKTVLLQAMRKNLNCPMTSSAGRLFDAVAALLGLCPTSSFEGEAAMALEFAAENEICDKSCGFGIEDGVIDWRPMVRELLADREHAAIRFHNTLVGIILAVARQAGEGRVLLTGGCFQNKLLLEKAVDSLEKAGFQPFRHHRLPPNDGGLAAGQVMAALRR